MDGVILHTDSKWAGFPIYDAQIGTSGQGIVEVDPASGFYVGQPVQFAVLAMGLYGTTPWQDGVIGSVANGQVRIYGTNVG